MARFSAFLSSLIWCATGLIFFCIGLFLAITIYPSRIFSADFYQDLRQWLAMDVFLGHYSPGTIDALLTLVPALCLVLGLTMLWAAVLLLQYSLFGRPLGLLSAGIAFNLLQLALLTVFTLYFSGAVSQWTDYVRAQLPQVAPMQIDPIAADPETVSPFLNIRIPSATELLNFYDRQMLPAMQVGSLFLILLIGALTAILLTSDPQPPNSYEITKV